MSETASILRHDRHLYIVYGFGDGKPLEELLASPHPLEILVFEPDSAMVNRIRSHFVDERISWISGTDTQKYISEIENYLKQKGRRYYFSGNHGNVVSSAGTSSANAPLFVEFAKSFRVAVSNMTSKIRSVPSEDHFRGLVNTLRNSVVYENFQTIDSLKNVMQGCVGVIVGSGPSLAHTIPFLKKHSDRVVIFSCDSALEVLLRHGIVPEFCGCLERLRHNAEFFINLPENLATRLVAPATLHPLAWEKFPGVRHSIGRIIGFESWLFPDLKRHYLGKLVSHLGFAILDILGCNTVCLFGLDGAYDPDSSAMYSKLASTNLEIIGKEAAAASKTLDFEVPGHDGKLKKTHFFWHEAGEIFSRLINETGIATFNVLPESFGIPISGAKRIDASEFEVLVNAQKKPKIPPVSSPVKSTAANSFGVAQRIAQGVAFLNSIKNLALDHSLKITEIMIEDHPGFGWSLEKKSRIFSEIEGRRTRLIGQNDFLFQAILLPLIYREHDLIEFDLYKVLALNLPDAVATERQLELYLKWYENLVIWIERTLHLIKSLPSEHA